MTSRCGDARPHVADLTAALEARRLSAYRGRTGFSPRKKQTRWAEACATRPAILAEPGSAIVLAVRRLNRNDPQPAFLLERSGCRTRRRVCISPCSRSMTTPNSMGKMINLSSNNCWADYQIAMRRAAMIQCMALARERCAPSPRLHGSSHGGLAQQDREVQGTEACRFPSDLRLGTSSARTI